MLRAPWTISGLIGRAPDATFLPMEPSQPLLVVCALVHLRGRFLAARRNAGHAFPGLWEFPGGKVEAGESSEMALRRELLEELSLTIRINQELEPLDWNDGSLNLRLLPFACEPDQAHGLIPHEHSEIRWVTPGEARDLDWVPADRPIVRQLARTTPPA
jgi:8-oxo-dGTP diphosphatase